LKPLYRLIPIHPRLVAPYTGAWIETLSHVTFACNFRVAPYTGAWIETPIPSNLLNFLTSSPLHGGVD